MKPLLWKEMRELRAWVLIGLGLVAALALMFQSPSFADRFLDEYLLVFLPFLVNLTAIGLGAGQVAKERQAKTLDYLLVRPVPAGAIVWAKFLAGTVALALLAAAMVGLVYTGHPEHVSTALTLIREHVSFWRLTLLLFPRLWCIYAASLWFSVLVDRAAKAWAAVVALAITLVALGTGLMDRSPFSSFCDWLPFVFVGGPTRAAWDPAFFWRTAGVSTAVALLLAIATAAFFKRWSERYLGNRTLALGSAIVIGASILAAHMVPEWLPTVRPAGFVEFPTDPDNKLVGLMASGGRVAAAFEHSILFLDFGIPAKPVKTAEIAIPLWTTKGVVMAGSTAYVLGQRKTMPVDEDQVAIVKLLANGSTHLTDTFSLGPVSSREFIGTPMPIGHFLYVGMARQGQRSLHVFDLSSSPVGRETAVLEIDRVSPVVPGVDRNLTFDISLKGSHLYVDSGSALTAIDVGNPARPLVTSTLELHPLLPLGLAWPHTLAWRGDRLYEALLIPEGLGAFDVSDAGHPATRATLAWREAGRGETGSYVLFGSGRLLYQGWKNGLIEFQPETSGVEALRYLDDGDEHAVQDATLDGEYVYAWKELKQINRVEAFWMGRPMPAQAKSAAPWSERLASVFRAAAPVGTAVWKVPSVHRR